MLYGANPSADGLLLVGTSSGEVYLIKHTTPVTVDRLQASSSLLYDLLQTGRKFIGLAPGSGTGKLIKLLPCETLLLTVSHAMSIWYDYSKPTNSKIDIELGLKLKQDIFNFNRNGNFNLLIVDAAAIPTGNKIILLVLSVTASDDSDRGGLWLHTCEVNASKRVSDESVFVILTRLCITADVDISTIGTNNIPRIWSTPCSWRVFVTYSQQTVHCVHIDALNPPTAVLGYDSMLPSADIISMNMVKGIDGVCLLTRDLTTLCLCPSLNRDYTATHSLKEIIGLKDNAYAQKQLVTLFWSICHQETALYAVLADVRNLLTITTRTTALAAVQEVSMAILAIAPDGRLWGLKGASDSLQIDHIQLSVELAGAKLIKHTLLIDILRAADLYQEEQIQQLVDSNQSKLLLVKALSDAIYLFQSHVPSQDTARVAATAASLQDTLTVLSAVYTHSAKASAINLHDLAARGMSIVDAFYADTAHIAEHVCSFAEVLEAQATAGPGSAGASGRAYGIMKILTQALQGNAMVTNKLIQSTLFRIARSLHTAVLSKHALDLKQAGVIVDFCQLFLPSYPQSSRDYEAAKTHAIGILLRLGYASLAYPLAVQFVYHTGMFQAVDQAPELFPEFLELLISRSQAQGTDGHTMGRACLLFLEAQGRTAEILKIGQRIPDELQAFLVDRPALAWIYALRIRQYDTALVALVDAARAADLVTSQALYSCAKLSARLHHTATKLPAVAGTVPVHAPVPAERVQAAEADINTALVIDRAQDILITAHPEMEKRKHSALELVQIILNLLPSTVDQVRLAGVALSLLDSAFKQTQRNSLPMLAAPAIASIDALTKQIWLTVLSINKEAWLELAALPDLSLWEQQSDLKMSLIFHAVTATAAAEVAQGGMSERFLLPKDSAVLDALIDQAGLSKLQLQEDGRLTEAAAENPRVRYAVKAIADVALSGGGAVPM